MLPSSAFVSNVGLGAEISFSSKANAPLQDRGDLCFHTHIL